MVYERVMLGTMAVVGYMCVLSTMVVSTAVSLLWVTLGRNSDLLPEAICCCLQTCNVVEIVGSHGAHTHAKYYGYTHYYELVIVKCNCNFNSLPEAICCCLQTCKFVYEIVLLTFVSR